MRNLLRLAANVLTISFIAAPVVEAVEYEIDPIQSFLEIVEGYSSVGEGTYVLNNIDVIQSTAGSLRTALGGTLLVERSGPTLTFEGGSFIDPLPNPNGPFLPTSSTTGSGSIEDNFGADLGIFIIGFLDLGDVALRDAAADIVGGSAIIGSPPRSLFFDVTEGVLDYELSANPAGPPIDWIDLGEELQQVNNETTEPLTEALDGTITIPFNLVFPFQINPDAPGDDSQLEMRGRLVATPVVGLPGDFDGDGTVDAVDYTVWRETLGDAASYNEWKGNYGATASATSSSIPEPASALPLLLAAGVLSCGRSMKVCQLA